jgi:FkbM family methyltransferase
MIDIAFVRQVGPLRWATRYASVLIRRRLLGLDSRIRLPTGAFMVLPKFSGSATEVYVTNANIDWGAEALFARFADRGRDFLDIGAHVGYYSAYLSPCVRRVYAFEPDPRNIPSLQSNARLAGNVEVIPMAVSSRGGNLRLSVERGSEVSTVVENSASERSIDVKATTIDAFVSARPGIDVGLVKTDVEGHDLEALRGMQGVVARHQPVILSECAYTGELGELCAQWNYRTFAFTRHRKTMKTRFQEMTGADLQNRWYKMLFFAPRHLSAAFSREATCQ